MKCSSLILALCGAFCVAHASAAAPVVPQSCEQVTLSYAPLVKQVAPAVVNIYTQRKVQQRLAPLFADPFFDQFFGGGLPQGLSRERLEKDLGSGVIVRADGLIVTSNHVIAGADHVRVVLSDRREFDAKVVAADEHTDLAALRVDAKGAVLPFLELRDSDTAEVGDLVLAIGDPFGVGQTVTSGIISAMAHGDIGSGDLGYFIQTDAAINPGNSGGALVTMDGKLVGINSAIYSKSGGNLGIGFAVPSNMVQILMSAVDQGRKTVTRAWIGIEAQDVTPELAASMDMPLPTGVLVKKLNSASPAGKAGLAVGDVIISADGHAIDDINAFNYRLYALSVGSKLDLSILRKGQKQDISIMLIAAPEVPPRATTEITGRNPFAGATIENVSPAVVDELGLHGVEHGVVVLSVKDNTRGASIGLQPGDILSAVQSIKVNAVADIVALTNQAVTYWNLTIQRGDDIVTVRVPN